jgi:hypothetical protein
MPCPPLSRPKDPARFLFFAGKGGVGAAITGLVNVREPSGTVIRAEAA